MAPEDTARVVADGSCVCAVTGVSTLERIAGVLRKCFRGRRAGAQVLTAAVGPGGAEFSQTLFALVSSCLSEAAETRINCVFVSVGV